MHFEVVSDRPVLIDAIGEMEPGVAVTLTDDMMRGFEALQGYPLVKANFPPFVQVTCVVKDEGE